jgi:CheY-like chemotaxis protein
MSAEEPLIMIVDDDFDVRETLLDILSGEGYRVIAAANGAEALELLQKGARPSLILLDLMMPVMDGETFCRVQRMEPELADIPVVAVSADPRAAEKARACGAAALLEKPVKLEALLEMISRTVT